MTTRDYCIKWGAYALALLPVWFLEAYVFSRISLWSTTPMLLPLAAVALAVLEGALAGAGFGIFAGMLCDMTYGSNGGMILLLALLGTGAGLISQFRLRQNLLGCWLCSAVALAIIDTLRILQRMLLRGIPLSALMEVALPELFWSLLFVPLVYGLFFWVHDRVPERTHF